MLLLTDGTVMVKSSAGSSDGYGNTWYRLTPDSTGSYVNSTGRRSLRWPTHVCISHLRF